MPDVIIPGPAGRLEGKYSPSKTPGAPVALILHAHPRGGGHMDTPVTTMMYDEFKARGFSVLRFNFRGAARARMIRGWANCLMQRQPSTGRKRTIPMPPIAGWPGIPSAPGSPCSF